MDCFDCLISFLTKNRPTCLPLFGKDSHRGVTVDLSQNIDVPLPNVLFLLELFKEKSHKYAHLGLDVLFDLLQLFNDLLHFWHQVPAKACLLRRKGKLSRDLQVLSLWNLYFISLFYVGVVDRRAPECTSDVFQLLVQLSLHYTFFNRQIIIILKHSLFRCYLALFPHCILLETVQMSNDIRQKSIQLIHFLFIIEFLILEINQFLWTIFMLDFPVQCDHSSQPQTLEFRTVLFQNLENH